jgi:hypothetical protein
MCKTLGSIPSTERQRERERECNEKVFETDDGGVCTVQCVTNATEWNA